MAAGPSKPICSRWRTALPALALAGLVGCATTPPLQKGRKAESLQNYDLAVAEYTKVLREHPDNKEALQGLERAKLRASQEHFTAARRLSAVGKLEEAMVELQIASELNPANGDIDRELQSTRTQLRMKVAVRGDGKTRLESVISNSLAAPLPGHDLPTDVTLPDSLVFREASSRDVFSAIGKFSNL